MDWSNERFVKLYVRETTTHRLLGWQAQALLPQILKLVDRSGVLDFGGVSAAEAIGAALHKWPAEVIEVGVAELQKRGVLSVNCVSLVVPNFLEAQTARQSDAHRQREHREKRRADSVSHAVTRGHEESLQTRLDETRLEKKKPNDSTITVRLKSVDQGKKQETTEPTEKPISAGEQQEIRPLLEDILAVTGDTDPRALQFFTKVCRQLGREVVYRLIGELRESIASGGVRNPGSVFTAAAKLELQKLQKRGA